MRANPRFLTLALIAGAAALGQARAATVTIVCGAVGQELTLCKANADAWAKKTGNTVKVLDTVNSSTDRLAYYQQNLSAGNDSIDVYQIDVVWPGILSNYFIDLKPYISGADLKGMTPSILANNEIGGKLIAIPWFTDGGVLYYRSDLLKKYGFTHVPQTWSELANVAKRIQTGEQKTNKNFYGYVYQGNAYEGLTCDALEWVASFGGGTIIDAKGNITINNPRAIAAINFAATSLKQVSPPGVTSYDEEGARQVFQSGNAAFMRNWPYAYSLGNAKGSVIAGKFDVTALPSGPGGKSAATQGGWALAVSKFSKNQKEAADLVKYLTSMGVQQERAVQGSYAPTFSALYTNAEVLKADPFFKPFAKTTPVARPSSVTGAKYNQVSSAFYTAVHNVLTGTMDAKTAVGQLEQQLKALKGAGW